MSRLTERLAALDRRVIGTPGDSRIDDYLAGYDDWWRTTQSTAKWMALIGYGGVTALATGVPYLLFDYPGNKGEVVVVGVTYWPLIWHFYLRHRRQH